MNVFSKPVVAARNMCRHGEQFVFDGGQATRAHTGDRSWLVDSRRDLVEPAVS